LSGAAVVAKRRARIRWADVLDVARSIMAEYTDTSVTLRQLFYRLVSIEALPNEQNAYKALSSRTAEARRAGTFPDFIDRNRRIHRSAAWADPEDALDWLTDIYRRDRTEGQEIALYLGVEKNGLLAQLTHWFGDLGLPILALGGYSSQTYCDDVRADAERDGRPSVFLYAGDFDPSGEDIPRDFIKRAGCFVERIALTPDQVEEYDLPPLPGKTTDPRAAGFIERHGQLVQVELDALRPDVLRDLFQQRIEVHFDPDAWQASMDQEDEDRHQLSRGTA